MIFLLRILLIFVVATLTVRAATWRTLAGDVVEGKLTGVYGELVLIQGKEGTYGMNVNLLDDASLRQVVDSEAAAVASPAPLWKTTQSKVGKAVLKRLQVLQGKKLVAFVPGERPEPEFYLIYFGALWCGPCRRFSPTLVETYRAMKAKAPDRFEAIFVSDDENASAQLEYMKEVNMPFPVLRYGTDLAVLNRLRGNGIPCLVVITRDGDTVFHSYNGEEYLGAYDPLEKFESLISVVAQPDQPRPAMHRLAIARHLRAAQNGHGEPRPYLLPIDPRRNRTLPKSGLTARVTLDAKGRVKEAEFLPRLEFIAEQQLQRETENWLFLPAVREGQAVGCVVDVPLQTDRL